ncbi:MAG: GntR family transcriptional regulator [Desulfovibrionaceae bacterium]
MVKITRRSLGQEATTLLRQMILDGQFVAGQRLVEDRISTDLGISRTPLREALHRLAQEGLLEKRAAGGYELRRTNVAELEDAVHVRALLEGHAAALAASRATEGQRQALVRNLADFQEAAQAEDVPRLIVLNEEFHATLRDAAGFVMLRQMLSELDGMVERRLRTNIPLEKAGQWSCPDHEHIVRAIEAHDPAAAAEAMRAHVHRGGMEMLAQLK